MSTEEPGEAEHAAEMNGFTRDQMYVILTQVLGKDSHAAVRFLASAERHENVDVANGRDVLSLRFHGWPEVTYSLRKSG
jgi:hypothetical protein